MSRGPEKKRMGAQRQRIGKIFCASLTGFWEVSARAVREIPRMYPPSPRARKGKRIHDCGVREVN